MRSTCRRGSCGAHVLLLLAACGGPSTALPPTGPMPAGAAWEGAWSTTFGEITFVATGIPEGPFAAQYAFPREAAPLAGNLYCNVADNMMMCATDLPKEHLSMVMQPDGRAFVANWWFDDKRWVRWEGER